MPGTHRRLTGQLDAIRPTAGSRWRRTRPPGPRPPANRRTAGPTSRRPARPGPARPRRRRRRHWPSSRPCGATAGAATRSPHRPCRVGVGAPALPGHQLGAPRRPAAARRPGARPRGRGSRTRCRRPCPSPRPRPSAASRPPARRTAPEPPPCPRPRCCTRRTWSSRPPGRRAVAAAPRGGGSMKRGSPCLVHGYLQIAARTALVRLRPIVACAADLGAGHDPVRLRVALEAVGQPAAGAGRAGRGRARRGGRTAGDPDRGRARPPPRRPDRSRRASPPGRRLRRGDPLRDRPAHLRHLQAVRQPVVHQQAGPARADHLGDTGQPGEERRADDPVTVDPERAGGEIARCPGCPRTAAGHADRPGLRHDPDASAPPVWPGERGRARGPAGAGRRPCSRSARTAGCCRGFRRR